MFLLPGNILAFYPLCMPAGHLTPINNTFENGSEIYVSQSPTPKMCTHLWPMMLNQPLYLNESIDVMYYPPSFVSFNSFFGPQLFGLWQQDLR